MTHLPPHSKEKGFTPEDDRGEGMSGIDSTADPIDAILDSIMSDESPITAEDLPDIWAFHDAVAVGKLRVAVKAIVERHLKGALSCAGRGHDTVPINIVAQDIREMGEEIDTVLRKGGDGWNRDISQAPRGNVVSKTVTTKDGPRAYEHFDAEWIWAATRKGEVIRTHWLPADGKHRAEGRWVNLASTEQPIAWQPYVVPVHPSLPSSLPEREQA